MGRREGYGLGQSLGLGKLLDRLQVQAGCPPELLSHGDFLWESWAQVALSRLAEGWAGPRVPLTL